MLVVKSHDSNPANFNPIHKIKKLYSEDIDGRVLCMFTFSDGATPLMSDESIREVGADRYYLFNNIKPVN